MVLYCVRWKSDKKLTKGKGRISTSECYQVLTVLTDSRKNALKAFEFFFVHEFARTPANKHDLTLDDGEISLSIQTVDSRKFIAHYMFLDGMREPLFLTDVASNVLRANKIFGNDYRF